MATTFYKMHGAGNDFIMLDGITGSLPSDLAAFSQDICHRRFGVGADQVLVALPSESCDFRMDIYNADGGRVEMCGNGIRSFAHYLHLLKLTDKTELTIETLAGVIKPQIIQDHPKTTKDMAWVKVDMGEPILNGPQIPVVAEGQVIGQEWQAKEQQELLEKHLGKFKITTVSMGNPHCVIFCDDVSSLPLATIGPVIENDAFFPNRVNVEFVQKLDAGLLIQRTWERGSGETYACGTGASAVAVAGVLNKVCDRKVTIRLKGGDLDLFWDQDNNRIFKTGPSAFVFKGEYHD